MQAFADESFNDRHRPTIGVDLKIVMENIDGKIAKLQLWDTAGQERFKTVIAPYYRGASGIMVVYDVTNEQSFENVQNYMTVIDQYAQSNISKILIGNRCDLSDDRQVSRKRGQAKADEYGMAFMETSAKTNMNIRESFIALAKDILDKRPKDILDK